MITIRSAVGSLRGIVSGMAMLGLIIGGILYFASQPGFASAARAEKSAIGDREIAGFKCSDGTLRGRYAVRGGGWIPVGPPGTPMVPFANVSLMTLDGAGNLIDNVTVSQNGQIAQNVDTGTYAIGENCKGTMTINIPNFPFQLHFDLVIADTGSEFFFIGTDPSVVTDEAKRLE